MDWFKVFPVLLVCFQGLDTSYPKNLHNLYGSEKVTIPVITSSSKLSSRFATYTTIPKECLMQGFCDVVDFYPEELAHKIIGSMNEALTFPGRDVNHPLPSLESRMMTNYNDGDNPCKFKEMVTLPYVARDDKNQWYYILNSENTIINTIRGIICKNGTNAVHTTDLILDTGFQAKCIQKYVYMELTTILDKKAYVKTFPIPAVCSCVAVPKH